MITQHNLKLLETKLSQQIGTPLGQDSQPLENVQETTIPILDEVFLSSCPLSICTFWPFDHLVRGIILVS